MPAMKLATSLERTGDLAKNIAKRAIVISEAEPMSVLTRSIERMGKLVRSQVAQSKQAFALRDPALAEDLVRQDAEVNRLNRECFTLALQIGDDPDRREWAAYMMLVARALERIGDNAVDVGEQTAFVVTGLFREFSDASHAGQATGS